jgi:hypothetical protein
MSDDASLYVQLTWEDPVTGELQQPVLVPPIALGRETHQMPERLGEKAVSRLELPHKQVSRFHALITLADRQLYITDRSANGTYLNGRLIEKGSQPLSSKDTLRVGPYKIIATLTQFDDSNSTELNVREQTHYAQGNPLQKNTLLMWLVGLGVLLLMGLGVWFMATTVLEQLRPRVPEAEQQSRLLDQPSLMIHNP